MTDLVGQVGVYLQTNPWLALPAVFVGGLLTASNPCVLAMIPLMIGFVAGRREAEPSVWRSLSFSLLFVLGLSITFTGLGIAAALAGTLYGNVSGIWNWVVAGVCVVMGLHMLGVLNFSIPAPIAAQPRLTGPLGALVMGLLFGFVSAPCAGPLLIVLLTYLAGTGASLAFGGLLLLVYALGHSVLILVAGTSFGAAKKLIESRNIVRVTAVMRRAAGVVIIMVGAFFFYRALA
jgi:cytochrome c-type biogenesis protein